MSRLATKSVPACLLLALAPLAGAQCPTEKLPAPVTEQYGFFGSYVAESAQRLVVSSNEFVGGGGGRHAWLYTWAPEGLLLRAKLSIPGGASAFSTPVDVHRDTVFLGNVDDWAERGAVHVFREQGGVWSETQKLVGSGLPADSHFGRRISLGDGIAAVAAPMDASVAYRGGAVFVFEEQGGTWVETARLDADPPHAWGFFGLGLDLDGDTLAVGEPFPIYGGPRSVRVYRRGPSGWSLEQRLQTPSGDFGYVVDVEGDRLAVGAPDSKVHVYERSGGQWVATQVLSTSAYGFGRSLRLDGPRLAVGTASTEWGGDDQVFLYERVGGSFELRQQLAPFDGQTSTMHGASLALTGDRLFVGAPGSDSSKTWSGALYAYALDHAPASTCSPAVANSTGLPGHLLASGCATVAANDLVLHARDLPAHRWGYFLVARSGDFVPAFGGGQGTLCLGTPLGRFVDQLSSTGPAGELDLAVDALALPLPGGAHAVLPGETWRFQCWYRDANPGPTSNLTDALVVSWL